MTIIAYRDGIMACDSCWHSGGLQVVSSNKLVRLEHGGLLGGAGGDDTYVIPLFYNVKTRDDFPKPKTLMRASPEYDGILVLPDESFWYVFCSKRNGAEIVPADTMGKYAAVGVGSTYALGAMAASEDIDAVKACEVAIKYNIYCRGPVHMMILNEEPDDPTC